mgnify:FL=1
MKFGLALLLCSYVSNTCLPPYSYPAQFNNQYDCLIKGYEESLTKIKEIGKQDVNQYEFYIKFICTQEQDRGENT